MKRLSASPSRLLPFVPVSAPETDPNDCANNDGDASLPQPGASKPYCVADNDLARGSKRSRCSRGQRVRSRIPAPECRHRCGTDEANCIDPTDPTLAESSSSTSGPTTETETSPDTETTEPTSETTTTTGPTGCQGPDDCSDPALAFCVDEVCVTCSAASEPDAACAQLDETAPLCIEDVCVQCSAENTDACGGVTPLCDVEASTCVPCEFHEQCQDIDSPACNFVTGACFDPANVTPVEP